MGAGAHAERKGSDDTAIEADRDTLRTQNKTELMVRAGATHRRSQSH